MVDFKKRLITSGPFKGLLRNHYKVILCDPPWAFKTYSEKGLDRSAEKHYCTMSLDDIAKLPVKELAAKDCALFMWITDPFLFRGMDLAKEWGFCVGVGTRVLTLDLRWVKAEDLKVGDKLLAFDEERQYDSAPKNGRRYYRPSEVLSTGVKNLESYEILLSTGEKLVCSEDHAWLMAWNRTGRNATMRWVTAKEVEGMLKNPRRRNPLAIPRVAPVCVQDNSYESGFLAGAYDGEGSLRKTKGGMLFAQKPNAMQEKVKEVLTKKGYEFSVYDRKADSCEQIGFTGGLKETLRFLMECRPPRLLQNWIERLVVASLYNLDTVSIVSVKRIGKHPCVTLSTSTRTYIAEGYPAHNTYKTVGFYWVKLNQDGKTPFTGLGHWTRANPEQALLCTTGHPKRQAMNVPKLIMAPRREHSRKPDEIFDRIESLVEGPYLELFAREPRAGWSAWGLEKTKFKKETFEEDDLIG